MVQYNTRLRQGFFLHLTSFNTQLREKKSIGKVRLQLNNHQLPNGLVQIKFLFLVIPKAILLPTPKKNTRTRGLSKKKDKKQRRNLINILTNADVSKLGRNKWGSPRSTSGGVPRLSIFHFLISKKDIFFRGCYPPITKRKIKWEASWRR